MTDALNVRHGIRSLSSPRSRRSLSDNTNASRRLRSSRRRAALASDLACASARSSSMAYSSYASNWIDRSSIAPPSLSPPDRSSSLISRSLISRSSISRSLSSSRTRRHVQSTALSTPIARSVALTSALARSRARFFSSRILIRSASQKDRNRSSRSRGSFTALHRGSPAAAMASTWSASRGLCRAVEGSSTPNSRHRSSSIAVKFALFALSARRFASRSCFTRLVWYSLKHCFFSPIVLRAPKRSSAAICFAVSSHLAPA
mmetsp:Transcript_11204/g.43672  ORF Transcript_11204/g.43672 Transcript_11204/m.43672 type:complete len:261 (-) Transcript_11204:181-963(-)